MSTFPVTSVTLIAKIKSLAPGEDSAAWVRFWNSYSAAIRPAYSAAACCSASPKSGRKVTSTSMPRLWHSSMARRTGADTPSSSKVINQFLYFFNTFFNVGVMPSASLRMAMSLGCTTSTMPSGS